MLVKHLMKSPVVSLFAEQSLPLARDIMKFRHVRHLPVIDDAGRLVGLVSHRDLLAAQVSSLTPVGAAGRGEIEESVQISELMQRDIWTAGVDMTVATAGRLLLDHRFGCLPVVDDDGILVGILTDSDFLRLAVGALEELDAETARVAGPTGEAADLARIA